jgi:hypothetical protein
MSFNDADSAHLIVYSAPSEFLDLLYLITSIP